jgi:hypothetical protein
MLELGLLRCLILRRVNSHVQLRLAFLRMSSTVVEMTATARTTRSAPGSTSSATYSVRSPYKPLPHRDIKLPKRQQRDGYVQPDLPVRHIATPF